MTEHSPTKDYNMTENQTNQNMNNHSLAKDYNITEKQQTTISLRIQLP